MLASMLRSIYIETLKSMFFLRSL
jgi:hypothetical protein